LNEKPLLGFPARLGCSRLPAHVVAIWLHVPADAFLYLDADALDDAIVAVDFQLPAALPGLRSNGVLSAATAHSKAVGWKLRSSIRLDADGTG
jgi:hypothetical protein